MKERALAGVYRLEESIDETGSLEVWRATDQRRRRTVAIRVPKVDACGDASDGFAIELDASGRLRDRCLTRALSAGADNAIPFLVSEFAEGRSLEEMLADDEHVPQRAARIVADLCRLVARARGAGLSHVAIEPRHLVIGRAGAKVTRFWAWPGTSREGAGFTAPEQQTAAVETEAEDVYNLGAILGALAGPAAGDGDEDRPLAEIARRATAEAPGDRYAGVAEMLDALRRDAERSRIRRQLRPAVALAAVAIAVGILATWFTGTTVTVPRVVGLRPPAAAASLRRTMLVPWTGPGGDVVRAQYPEAGARVHPRSAVRLLSGTQRSR